MLFGGSFDIINGVDLYAVLEIRHDRLLGSSPDPAAPLLGRALILKDLLRSPKVLFLLNHTRLSKVNLLPDHLPLNFGVGEHIGQTRILK